MIEMAFDIIRWGAFEFLAELAGPSLAVLRTVMITTPDKPLSYLDDLVDFAIWNGTPVRCSLMDRTNRPHNVLLASSNLVFSNALRHS